VPRIALRGRLRKAARGTARLVHVLSQNEALVDASVLDPCRKVTMSHFHTIVVAVDFSPTSLDTLEAACELARPHHGRVHLVHVVPDPFHLPYTIEPTGINWSEVSRRWTADARTQLEQLAAHVPADQETRTIAVVSGAPASEIMRYARDQNADVIVLGSHGHGFMERLMLGSVAERVVRHAACPVLLVPHHTASRLTSFEVQAAAGVGS
jgi:nucleotide-binding universal stress UspA family protein